LLNTSHKGAPKN